MLPTDSDAFEQARAAFLAGLTAFQEERFDDSERHYRASLSLLPERTSTLTNLAAVLVALERHGEALSVAERAIEAEPGNVDAWFHVGQSQAALGRPQRALNAFDRILELDATRALAWCGRGDALQAGERTYEALEAYGRAVALEPTLAPAWSSRGGVLRELGRTAEAADAYRQALAHGADPALHHYYLASVGAAATPDTAPAQYVAALFDDYAPAFDEHLLQVLRYRAHRAMGEQLAMLGCGPVENALDLGCGTGLCAHWARPLARRLVGVDLSSGMLAQARTLGLYDQLHQADIRDYFASTDERFRLVLAADVFIYLGDLDAVFAQVRAHMPPGGIFCFSVECAPPSAVTGFVLLPSLRYAHTDAYVNALAQSHAFAQLQRTQLPIREEQGRTIDGIVWVLRADSPG